MIQKINEDVIMDTKEKIIRTAMNLFVSQGIDSTPTSKISKEAGVATGTLFHHFKTKEDLINEVYLFVKRNYSSYIIEEIIDTTKDVKMLLKEIWDNGIRWGEENSIEVKFMIDYSNSKHISLDSKEKGSSIIAPFDEVFVRGRKEKILKNLSTTIFRSIYVGIFTAFIFSEDKSRSNIDNGFEVFWDAISN